MNIVLLSGGSGKRLWPLSNDIRSKQFIKIFKTEDGGYESMLQRVYRQIKQVDPDAKVTMLHQRLRYRQSVIRLGRMWESLWSLAGGIHFRRLLLWRHICGM